MRRRRPERTAGIRDRHSPREALSKLSWRRYCINRDVDVNGVGERVGEDLGRGVPGCLGRRCIGAEIRLEAGRECGGNNHFDPPGAQAAQCRLAAS